MKSTILLALLLATVACTGDDPVTARRKEEERKQMQVEEARRGAELSADKMHREMEDLSKQIVAAKDALDAAKDDAERSVLRKQMDELTAKLRELKRDAYRSGGGGN